MELFDLTLERALLATAMEGVAVGGFDALEGVEARHFYTTQHQALFAACASLRAKAQPIAEIFVKRELGERYHEDTMLDILATTPLVAPAPYCASLIDLFKRRELQKLATNIRRFSEEEENVSDAIAAVKKTLAEIEAMGETNTKAKSYDLCAKEDAAKPPLDKFPLGVSFLDDAFRGGWEAGQLILIGGEPEAGKTMLATQIMKHIAKTSPVLFFCFEFTVRKFVQTQKEVEGEGWNAPNLQIIDDGYDISQIEREIRFWAKRDARFVVIDSQMRIENNAAKTATVEERETEKFSRLAKLAHKLELVIVLVIQTSKLDAASGVIAPTKSKNGAHEASVILYLKRIKEKDNPSSQKRELLIAKNKQNGVHFKNEITFNPYKKAFYRHYETTYNAGDIEIPVEIES
ncbi:MAG: hypothetical protein LBF86_02045 [Helicobacteraceae bacterium]|jgi:DNA repair protein RadA/Sms|nr:hypothetical protein [Helicobacteraceae bacterium]